MCNRRILIVVLIVFIAFQCPKVFASDELPLPSVFQTQDDISDFNNFYLPGEDIDDSETSNDIDNEDSSDSTQYYEEDLEYYFGNPDVSSVDNEGLNDKGNIQEWEIISDVDSKPSIDNNYHKDENNNFEDTENDTKEGITKDLACIDFEDGTAKLLGVSITNKTVNFEKEKTILVKVDKNLKEKNMHNILNYIIDTSRLMVSANGKVLVSEADKDGKSIEEFTSFYKPMGLNLYFKSYSQK
jgi:hypothetical protein